MKPPETEELCALLRTWNDVPAEDADLARRVRRLVRASRDPATLRTRFAAGWSALLFSFETRRAWPRLAAVGVAAGVLVGLGAAEWRHRREQAGMPALYLRWIDPVPPAANRMARS